MYISILFDLQLLQGFLELPKFMPKTSNKDGTMDSLIYSSHSRLKLEFMCISDLNRFRASGKAF